MWESTKGKKPWIVITPYEVPCLVFVTLCYTVYDGTWSCCVSIEYCEIDSLCLFQSFYFKLRSMIPCCLCHLNFAVAVPEEELIQVRTLSPSLIYEIAYRTELILKFKFYCTSVCLPPRLQWQQLPWRLTKTRHRRSQQTSTSPKVCLVEGD